MDFLGAFRDFVLHPPPSASPDERLLNRVQCAS